MKAPYSDAAARNNMEISSSRRRHRTNSPIDPYIKPPTPDPIDVLFPDKTPMIRSTSLGAIIHNYHHANNNNKPVGIRRGVSSSSATSASSSLSTSPAPSVMKSYYIRGVDDVSPPIQFIVVAPPQQPTATTSATTMVVVKDEFYVTPASLLSSILSPNPRPHVLRRRCVTTTSVAAAAPNHPPSSTANINNNNTTTTTAQNSGLPHHRRVQSASTNTSMDASFHLGDRPKRRIVPKEDKVELTIVGYCAKESMFSLVPLRPDEIVVSSTTGQNCPSITAREFRQQTRKERKLERQAFRNQQAAFIPKKGHKLLIQREVEYYWMRLRQRVSRWIKGDGNDIPGHIAGEKKKRHICAKNSLLLRNVHGALC